jgi:hypothetical protein
MAPTSTFQGYGRFVAITTSNTVNIPQQPGNPYAAEGLTDALYVGTAGSTGTIVAVMANGLTCTFVGLLAGMVYPFRVLRINATTTDASDLVGLYQA